MVSVTAYARKYRYELFFQTEVNVILLQVLFGLVILGIVALSLIFLYQDVSTALTTGIQEGSATTASPQAVGATIVSQLIYMSARHVIIVVAAIILVTVLFSYLIATLTLAPARSALGTQKKFIGNIAHELRTPLSTIKTNTEVALFDPDIPKGLREILESNIEEMDRISDIINNLLSLNASLRPEKLSFSSVNMCAIADTVERKLRRLAERKNIIVRMRSSTDCYVTGNPTAVEQIITNILKNAISYTPRDGIVDITIQERGVKVALTIVDSGVGIAPQDLTHIFEPFYRADPSRNRSEGQGGSGLGLTIVNELVRLHSGKVHVDSIVGSGTTVEVLLPSAKKRSTLEEDLLLMKS